MATTISCAGTSSSHEYVVGTATITTTEGIPYVITTDQSSPVYVRLASDQTEKIEALEKNVDRMEKKIHELMEYMKILVKCQDPDARRQIFGTSGFEEE